MKSIKYWIAVASENHVKLWTKLWIMQVCHGKLAPLKRLKKWDFVVYYSSKVEMNSEEKCQSFTALGEVMDDEIYQVEMFSGFVPYRRRVNYQKVQKISILPLLDKLEFIKDKTHWGYPFRYGLLEISQNDFKFLHSLMIDND